jgi:hypothetical protein
MSGADIQRAEGGSNRKVSFLTERTQFPLRGQDVLTREGSSTKTAEASVRLRKSDGAKPKKK